MKKVIFCVLFLIVAVFVTQIHSVQAYSWLGDEILTSKTTRFNKWLGISPYGETHQLMKVTVNTEKFYFRTENCQTKVEIYILDKAQSFSEVSGSFSNGACELYKTVECNDCIALEEGRYIFKIITYPVSEKFENFLAVFGPPVRSS